jgi:pre-rRNA-processing protein TSR3
MTNSLSVPTRYIRVKSSKLDSHKKRSLIAIVILARRTPLSRQAFSPIHWISSISYPPTIIVRDKRENQRKCSIVPLHGRPDMIFFTHPVTSSLNLGGYVRLAADGPELSSADADSGLLLLDGSWRRAGIMTKAYEHVPPRSLRGFQTAYPRVSKRGTDPGNGLASVEALFLACHILGRPTEGLLDHYRWAEDFRRLNRI